VTIADPVVFKTPRELLRQHYREQLEQKAQEIYQGPLVGKKVVLVEDVNFVLNQAFPPVSDHGAEISTPGRVVVWAACPRCGLAGAVSVELTPELRVDSHSGALHLKAKSKPVTHACGQLGLRDGQTDGQESFELEDIIRDGDTADEEAEDDADALAIGDVVQINDEDEDVAIQGVVVAVHDDGSVAVAKVADGDFLVLAPAASIQRADLALFEKCDYPFCPLQLEHKGVHRPINAPAKPDPDEDPQSEGYGWADAVGPVGPTDAADEEALLPDDTVPQTDIVPPATADNEPDDFSDLPF
jgi:hypothetical protein